MESWKMGERRKEYSGYADGILTREVQNMYEVLPKGHIWTLKGTGADSSSSRSIHAF